MAFYDTLAKIAKWAYNPVGAARDNYAEDIEEQIHDWYARPSTLHNPPGQYPGGMLTRSPEWRKWRDDYLSRHPRMYSEIMETSYEPNDITDYMNRVKAQLDEQKETGVRAYDQDGINWPTRLAHYLSALENGQRRFLDDANTRNPWGLARGNERAAQAFIDAETQVRTNPVFQSIIGDTPERNIYDLLNAKGTPDRRTPNQLMTPPAPKEYKAVGEYKKAHPEEFIDAEGHIVD